MKHTLLFYNSKSLSKPYLLTVPRFEILQNEYWEVI